MGQPLQAGGGSGVNILRSRLSCRGLSSSKATNPAKTSRKIEQTDVMPVSDTDGRISDQCTSPFGIAAGFQHLEGDCRFPDIL